MNLRVLMRVLVLALLAALGPLPSWIRAEYIGPGTYRGTYHVDRWRQHHFRFLFVSPDLDKALKPYMGVPVSLEATDVSQPDNPGGAMIMKVGRIEKLPSPVDIAISWLEPARGVSDREREHLRQLVHRLGNDVFAERERSQQDLIATGPPALAELRRALGNADLEIDRRAQRCVEAIEQSPARISPEDALRRVPVDGMIRFKVTVTNRSSKELSLNENTFYLSLDSQLPWGNYAGNANCYHERGFGSQDVLCIYSRMTNLLPKSQAVDGCWRCEHPGPRLEHAPVLKDGGSFAWTVGLERQLPPNECELYVTCNDVRSNVLRLDVLSKAAEPWQGLAIDLQADKNEKAPANGEIPLQIRFTNKGQKLLRFILDKNSAGVDLSEALFCYDRHGDRLYLPTLKRITSETVRLEPEKSLTFRTKAPAGTALARVAFLHRYLIQDVKEDETALGSGVIFSQHLLFPPPQGVRR